MRKKAIMKAAALLLLAVCLLSAPASAAGGAGDSLVSESWVESWGDALLDKAVGGISSELDGAADAGLNARTVVLSDGDMLTLSAGASAALISGSASVRVTGTVIDVTAGTTAKSGDADARSLYVAASDSSAVFTAEGGARFSVWGSAKVTQRTVVFTDVPEGNWYYDYVYAAVSAGLINGMTSTTFEPESGFTVAQAIKIAACLHQYYYDGSVTLENDPEVWFKSYISYAVENGICDSSYDTMSYDKLNAPIDRRDFAVIFYNAMPAYEYTPINTVESIPDVAESDEAAKEIYALYRAGILNGKQGDGSYKPDDGIRRNEAATIVARMLDEDLRVKA